jgi:hypothetical protein
VTRLTAKILLSTALCLALLAGLTRFVIQLRAAPKPFAGYTLIAPLVSTRTYLIDMGGRVVHTWDSQYTAGQCAYLLDNGHLLRECQLRREERLFAGPAGGGRLQEFDWEGGLVWDFKFHMATQLPHQDFTRLPNGNVLLIV